MRSFASRIRNGRASLGEVIADGEAGLTTNDDGTVL
jgi:hypothetical protein